MKDQKIVINDTERSIYEIYLQEENNRFVNAFKLALLRGDFYSFLSEYKETYREKPEQAASALSGFLRKIEQSKYSANLDADKRLENMRILSNFFALYYPTFVFRRNLKEGKPFIYDPMFNFPKINYSIFYEDILNKYFRKEIYTEEMPSGGLLSEEEKKRPRVLQITCDDSTKKEELIKYIETFWDEIKLFLGDRKQNEPKTRDKASKSFLRDVDIYNRYYETDSDLDPRPLWREGEIAEEFSKKSEPITQENVRKIVSSINQLHESINT